MLGRQKHHISPTLKKILQKRGKNLAFSFGENKTNKRLTLIRLVSLAKVQRASPDLDIEFSCSHFGLLKKKIQIRDI